MLWLRHSFARAFSGDSLLGDSLPVDCFGCRLAMTHPLPPPQGRGKMEAGFSRTPFVIASEHNVRARQSNVYEARIMGILCLLIATLTLAMTQNSACKKYSLPCSRQRCISWRATTRGDSSAPNTPYTSRASPQMSPCFCPQAPILSCAKASHSCFQTHFLTNSPSQ